MDVFEAMNMLFEQNKPILIERAGPMLDAAAAAERLGVSAEELTTLVAERRVLAVDDGGLRFPACQFDTDGHDDLLQAFLSVTAKMNAWVVLDHLTVPDPAYLDQTMMDLIRAGRGDAIRRFAAQLDGNGFW